MKRFLVYSVVALAVLSLGLVLIHCGGGGDGKQCETNEDCPTGYWCDRTVWECKIIDCIPNCTGKCCGDDECGGTCTDNCPTGYECNATTCVCESTGCNSDSDCTLTQCCLQGVCTDMSCGNGTWQCGNDSVCTAKSCGTCDTAGTHCDFGTNMCVQDVTCTDDNDCQATECCTGTPGTCSPEDCSGRACGADPVCGHSCGTCPAGQTCNAAGQCETEPFEGECPTDQQCTDLTTDGSGYYGCVIPPMTVPPNNETDCDPSIGDWCVGNFTCVASDPVNVCIENCGSCPTDTVCTDMLDGYMGCMTAAGGIPPGAATCGQGNPCVGNGTCWNITSGGVTQTVCIANCNLGYGCTTEGETRCIGHTIETCTSGTWVDTTDCTASSQVCFNGACTAPGVAGDFCGTDTYPACGDGLDCVGASGGPYACLPQCDCENGTGCDTGWECLWSDQDPTDPTCWCGKMCPNNDPATDCPNGGTGWTCVETEAGSGIYYCDFS